MGNMETLKIFVCLRDEKSSGADPCTWLEDAETHDCTGQSGAEVTREG